MDSSLRALEGALRCYRDGHRILGGGGVKQRGGLLVGRDVVWGGG